MLNSICFFFSLLLTSFLIINVNAIVNGNEAKIEKYPFMASLRHGIIHRCGATIINETTLLTAAHCLNKGVSLARLSVRAGSTDVDRGHTTIPVKNYKIHEKFNIVFDNDIAIVWLQFPLVFGSNIQPATLPIQNELVQVGEIATLLGWGRLSKNGPYPNNLQQVDLPILDIKVCTRKGAYESFMFNGKKLCAGYMDGGKDACQSDSGGPLVIGKKLIGIVSFGIGCAKANQPGGYTKVSAFIEWIHFNRHID